MSEMTWDPTKVRHSVASMLTEIVRMWGELGEEAIHRSDESDDWPGGEALALMAPVANLEAWQHRYSTAEERGFTSRKGDDYASDQSDDTNVLLTLATWEDAVRDERDQPSDLRATVPRAAAYLRSSLDWMLGTDEYGNLNFLAIDHLETDLREIKGSLERLLHDGRQVDRGVNCMKCGARLVKIWGHGDQPDRWRCPGCGQGSTEEQYHQAVRADYLENADYLSAEDMLIQYRIKPGSLRTNASRGRVDKRVRQHDGRTEYRVEDALLCRDRDTRVRSV